MRFCALPSVYDGRSRRNLAGRDALAGAAVTEGMRDVANGTGHRATNRGFDCLIIPVLDINDIAGTLAARLAPADVDAPDRHGSGFDDARTAVADKRFRAAQPPATSWRITPLHCIP